ALEQLADESAHLDEGKLVAAPHKSGGEGHTEQERQLPVKAALREARVGQPSLGVDERSALGAMFGAEPGRVGDQHRQIRRLLGMEVSTLVLLELVEVDDGVLDQAAGERVPERAAAALVSWRVLAGVQQVLRTLDLGQRPVAGGE